MKVYHILLMNPEGRKQMGWCMVTTLADPKKLSDTGPQAPRGEAHLLPAVQSRCLQDRTAGAEEEEEEDVISR